MPAALPSPLVSQHPLPPPAGQPKRAQLTPHHPPPRLDTCFCKQGEPRAQQDPLGSPPGSTLSPVCGSSHPARLIPIGTPAPLPPNRQLQAAPLANKLAPAFNPAVCGLHPPPEIAPATNTAITRSRPPLSLGSATKRGGRTVGRGSRSSRPRAREMALRAASSLAEGKPLPLLQLQLPQTPDHVPRAQNAL